MNRLQLVQALRREAGAGGGSSNRGPDTTINQTGEYGRLVSWIDGAWLEIQSEGNYDFMWEAASITVPAGEVSVAGTIPSRRYDKDGTYLGSKNLTFLPWMRFRSLYPQSLVGQGEPSVWTIRPDKAFVVDRKPLIDTTISVERWKNPKPMLADEDEPSMPSEHHMAIVWKALLLYADFEEVGVTRATAEAKYNRHMMGIARTELPEMEFGDPLC